MEEKYKDFKIGCSPITGEIFLGKLNKKGNMWLEGKTIVTDKAVNAVFDHLNNKKIFYSIEVDGKDKHMILINDAEMEVLKKYRNSK